MEKLVFKDHPFFGPEKAKVLGGMRVFEVPVGESGAGHIHDNEEEVYLMLQGEADMKIGDETHPIGPGDVVYIPVKTWHEFQNTGTTSVRGIYITGKVGECADSR